MLFVLLKLVHGLLLLPCLHLVLPRLVLVLIVNVEFELGYISFHQGFSILLKARKAHLLFNIMSKFIHYFLNQANLRTFFKYIQK